jgi:hypothetical protein
MATYTHYPSERAKDLMHSYRHPNPFIHVDAEDPVVGVLLDMCAPKHPKRPQLRPVQAHKRVIVVATRTEPPEAVIPHKSMVSYRSERRNLS